jgi:hypothetical protein
MWRRNSKTDAPFRQQIVPTQAPRIWGAPDVLPVIELWRRSGAGANETRCVSEPCPMGIDGVDQNVAIGGPADIAFVGGDNLVCNLPQSHHLAELHQFAGLAFAMISVDGSNTLTILPSLRASPRLRRCIG